MDWKQSHRVNNRKELQSVPIKTDQFLSRYVLRISEYQAVSYGMSRLSLLIAKSIYFYANSKIQNVEVMIN